MKYTIHVLKNTSKGKIWEPQVTVDSNDEFFTKALKYVKSNLKKRKITPNE
jgi:hypothetical protein